MLSVEFSTSDFVTLVKEISRPELVNSCMPVYSDLKWWSYFVLEGLNIFFSSSLFLQLHQSGVASFVDTNPNFDDLSASFRSLYKQVFENTQGKKSDTTLFPQYSSYIYIYIYRNFACIRHTFLHKFLPIIWGCVSYTEIENQGVLHRHTEIGNRWPAIAAPHIRISLWYVFISIAFLTCLARLNFSGIKSPI